MRRSHEARTREPAAHGPQLRECRGIELLHQVDQFPADLLRVPAQRDLDAARRAEQVHHQRKVGALHPLEEQRRPVLPDDPLHQFRHFVLGIDFDGNADQLALPLELRDERLQVGKANCMPSYPPSLALTSCPTPIPSRRAADPSRTAISTRPPEPT